MVTLGGIGVNVAINVGGMGVGVNVGVAVLDLLLCDFLCHFNLLTITFHPSSQPCEYHTGKSWR